MSRNGNLPLAVLAGISIGAVGFKAIHAQEVKTPPAYLIAETEVNDPAWCDAATARLYAVTMVGGLEMWLKFLQQEHSVGILDEWFSRKAQNGARVTNLFRAFRK